MSRLLSTICLILIHHIDSISFNVFTSNARSSLGLRLPFAHVKSPCDIMIRHSTINDIQEIVDNDAKEIKSNLKCPQPLSKGVRREKGVTYTSSFDEFTNTLRTKDFQSGLYLYSSDVDGILDKISVAKLEDTSVLPNFDHDNIRPDDIESALDCLLGESLKHDLYLRDDMRSLIEAVQMYDKDADLICRLALMSNVRCPKWHEDYVKVRLIKTYYGIGTEWTNPENVFIRLNNWMKSQSGDDLVVPKGHIKRMNQGDAMVMSGRYRANSNLAPGDAIPILHRSPIEEDNNCNCRRLLFTITVP